MFVSIWSLQGTQQYCPKSVYLESLLVIGISVSHCHAKIGSNSFGRSYRTAPLEHAQTWIHMKIVFFFSSLELLVEVCRIWASGPKKGAKIKGPMGPNLSGTYLGDCWADFHDFHDSKAIWKPIGIWQWSALAWSFSLRYVKRVHEAQLLSGI